MEETASAAGADGPFSVGAISHINNFPWKLLRKRVCKGGAVASRGRNLDDLRTALRSRVFSCVCLAARTNRTQTEDTLEPPPPALAPQDPRRACGAGGERWGVDKRKKVRTPKWGPLSSVERASQSQLHAHDRARGTGRVRVEPRSPCVMTEEEQTSRKPT